jgi:hypothetical protein
LLQDEIVSGHGPQILDWPGYGGRAFLASRKPPTVTSHAVEHSCYQCGVSVEDGIPFCRQCNAPQIRVATAEAITPAEVISEGLPPQYSRALPAGSIDWPHALRAAALAGLLAVILLIILRQAFALDMLAAGFLSVYFYRRKNPFSNLTAGIGALLGTLSGLFGGVMFAIPCVLAIFVFRAGGDGRAAMVATVQQQVAHTADPRAQEILEYMKTPEGFTLMMSVLVVAMLILFLVLSSFGGAIAAALLRRRQRL